MCHEAIIYPYFMTLINHADPCCSCFLQSCPGTEGRQLFVSNDLGHDFKDKSYHKIAARIELPATISTSGSFGTLLFESTQSGIVLKTLCYYVKLLDGESKIGLRM